MDQNPPVEAAKALLMLGEIPKKIEGDIQLKTSEARCEHILIGLDGRNELCGRMCTRKSFKEGEEKLCGAHSSRKRTVPCTFIITKGKRKGLGCTEPCTIESLSSNSPRCHKHSR